MGKMKPLGKILIALLMIGSIIGALKYSGVEIGGNKTLSDSTTSEMSIDSEKENSGENGKRTFEYIPEKPVDGKLKGVIEVGASGFNSFVVNMDNQKRWELVSKEFGESLAYEGMSSTEDIRLGLRKYIAKILEKGVNKNQIHFVISSGAQKSSKTKEISNELKKMGYVVNLVTATEEGNYAFKSTVPPSFQDNSYMMDIGSGNTKISYEENGILKSIEGPGAKYYQLPKTNEQVKDEFKALIAKLPENKRNVAFVLGGVPFSLAKQNRSGDERYTVLNKPSTYEYGADKKLESGLNIYNAVKKNTGTDTFVFDWDSNFTIGFLLGLKN